MVLLVRNASRGTALELGRLPDQRMARAPFVEMDPTPPLLCSCARLLPIISIQNSKRISRNANRCDWHLKSSIRNASVSLILLPVLLIQRRINRGNRDRLYRTSRMMMMTKTPMKVQIASVMAVEAVQTLRPPGPDSRDGTSLMSIARQFRACRTQVNRPTRHVRKMRYPG